jgi:hypothetical protein
MLRNSGTASPPPPASPREIVTVPQGLIAVAVRKTRFFGSVCASGLNRISVFAFAIMATIAFPCLPVFIEWYRTGSVKSDTYYITAAVLASAFAVSAEHIAFIGLYITSFVINLILDMVHGPFSAVVDVWAGSVLAAVRGLHISERVWWHVFLDRPFPDRW